MKKFLLYSLGLLIILGIFGRLLSHEDTHTKVHNSQLSAHDQNRIDRNRLADQKVDLNSILHELTMWNRDAEFHMFHAVAFDDNGVKVTVDADVWNYVGHSDQDHVLLIGSLIRRVHEAVKANHHGKVPDYAQNVHVYDLVGNRLF